MRASFPVFVGSSRRIIQEIHPIPEVIGQGSHEHALAYTSRRAAKVIQPEQISFVGNAE